jgi:signal transduction histidine kinase
VSVVTVDRARDPALAVGLAALGVCEVLVPLASRQDTGSASRTTVDVLLMCLPLVWRRRYPLAVLAAVVVDLLAFQLLGQVYLLFYGLLLPLIVASYAVARHGRGRAPALGAALTAGCLATLDRLVPRLGEANEIAFQWGVFVIAWAAAIGFRVQSGRAAAAMRRAVEAEVRAAETALAAVVDERTRIARELHDIVAHSVSLMVVQAGAAQQVVQEDAAYVSEALETIRTTGQTALGDMRRVVEMLRDGGQPSAHAPQPGLARLDALIADARAAGLDASLAVSGAQRPLPPGVDLAAFRIVQEALSNVRRHARATRVRVGLRYAAESVTVEIADDGVGTSAQPPSGHGLVGMRERAVLYGGSLELHSEGAGLTVRAVLPVRA